ncbi:synaptophysin 1 [Sigmodon hispidus]
MSTFQINLNPLKEPLGFIKVLEWFASIFAFATCGGFKGKTEIQASCPSKPGDNKTVTATFGYPFRLNQASFHAPPNVNVCEVKWEDQVLIGDYSSSAQFYVTFAVFVFLYCIAALLLYVGYTNLYRDSRKLTMIDFIVTLVAAFLWLVSSSAWAKALTDIKIATGHSIIGELEPCRSKVSCHFVSVTSMGSLNVSVIFGFLNMILWGGNAWFVYKETSLHSPSNTSTSHSQGELHVPGSGCREDEGNLATAAPHPQRNLCELLQNLASYNDPHNIRQLFLLLHSNSHTLFSKVQYQDQEPGGTLENVVQA